MKKFTLPQTSFQCSRLAYGCWRLAEADQDGKAGRAAVIAAFEAGYNLFDLADIYGGGRSEEIFGEALKEDSEIRGSSVIATKCGIRKPGDPSPKAPYHYDFSHEYIVTSCEGSLKRMGIETIDLYQLHRPDWLCDPHEVADAISQLCSEGKVRQFGVSNFAPSQVSMLQQATEHPIIVNQVEISLAKLDAFTDGTLDQCLERDITPMAWSPLGGGKLGDGEHRVLGHQEGYQTEPINAVLDELAREHDTSRANIALAWLLRHPSNIMPIIGSTNPQHIRDAAHSTHITLSRVEWYRLLEASRGTSLP